MLNNFLKSLGIDKEQATKALSDIKDKTQKALANVTKAGQEKFGNAQVYYQEQAERIKVKVSSNLDAEKFCQVEFIIHTAATAAAAASCSLAQGAIVGADTAILVPIHYGMIIKLGETFGRKVNKSQAEAMLGAAVGVGMGTFAVKAVLGIIPIAGNLVNAAISAAYTELLGWTFVEWFYNEKDSSIPLQISGTKGLLQEHTVYTNGGNYHEDNREITDNKGNIIENLEGSISTTENHQTGQFGIGHMSGGQIGGNARIAGVYNQKSEGDISMTEKHSFSTGDVKGGVVGGRDASGVAAGNDISGTVAGGDIYGTVSTAISELPDSPESEKPGVKELLTQLKEAIASESNLSDEDKESALEEISNLAEAAKNPEDGRMKKAAKKAVQMLTGIFAGLPALSKLVETAKPVLSSWFGW
jgi:uncharacterized protein (DUF697 family)